MIRVLAPALLATLLVAVPTSAVSVADDVRARPAAGLSTRYECDSAFGGGRAPVQVRAKLPRSVQAGERVKPRPVRVALTVPKALVGELRRNNIDSLEGTSDSARLFVGSTAVRVAGLAFPTTAVPDSGRMVLRGSGTTKRFAIRTAGKQPVRVPRRLAADVTATIDNYSSTQRLTCALLPEAPRRLATLLVKD